MDKSLAVTEQKTVEFYGDDIVAIRATDGTVYIPVRPICELLGVDWNGQRRRINRDAVLSQEIQGVDVTSTPGGTQTMLCLPLDYISGFLFGLNPDRTKPELRDRIIRYQRECYKVLNEAFQEGRLTADPSFSELLNADSPAAQAYRMARAVMELARNQVLLESRLESHGYRLDDHERRLEDVEATLGDTGRLVTPDQASQISQAVKAVAIALGKKSGRNEFGGVYGELYRKFGITGYKQLPAAKFQGAMVWLNEWREELEGDLPF
jgi:hypothetical protein